MNLRELNLDPTLESHLVYEMSVQQVQDSNEEFVGILLLVSCQQIIYFLFQQFFRVLLFYSIGGLNLTCQMVGMGPDHVEQLVGGEGCGFPAKEFLTTKRFSKLFFRYILPEKAFPVKSVKQLWIQIQIGFVFSNFEDPDPYFEYGSGSTQVKMVQIRGTSRQVSPIQRLNCLKMTSDAIIFL